MTTPIAIDDKYVGIVLERVPGILRATMLISKTPDSDPLRDESVALIVEAANGALLKATSWPTPGILPETFTRGATANAAFEFKLPKGTGLKRAIAVVRGEFGEIDLTNE
ncbi:MAG: hypothetical protein IH602_24115 [Bryobacteraceae bacterium]|nr:hypothetical protein [Bryobacteraceae bacterium]